MNNTYKDTYMAHEVAINSLESHIWYIIDIAIDYDSDEDYSYINILYHSIPDGADPGWDIDIKECVNGITCYFKRTIPYEVWVEEATVHFTWEELEYNDSEILTMWKERGKELLEDEEEEELRKLTSLAEQLGYDLIKKGD